MNAKTCKRLALSLLATLSVVGMTAQRFSSFPPLSKGEVSEMPRPLKVSPNQDKESGVKMYGATNSDGTMYCSWTSFRSLNLNSINRHFTWIDAIGDDDFDRGRVIPATGAYNPEDGKYYVMISFVYDCVWAYRQVYNYEPDHWFSIDIKNSPEGPAVMLNTLQSYATAQGWDSYSMDPNAPHWGLWMDMAFDPVDGVMYAMAQSEETITEENPFHSALVQVSLSDGMYRVKKQLSGKYYLGFTYDMDGKIYAARWTEDASGDIVGSAIVELDRSTWQETRVVAELRKDGLPFQLCYNGTLEVDRTTGDLYYAGCDYNNGYQYLFKIDPTTGENTCLGSFTYNNITGLHIPYLEADSRDCPARVENLKTAFAEGGINEITLTWTNPSKQWNLEELESLTGVRIYRDDIESEPIADLTEGVTVGGDMSYVDKTAEQGLHTYYLIPYSDKGDGVVDNIAAFVGRDLPGNPVITQAYANTPDRAYIEWTAPETGANDGWFDASSLKYTVVRSDGEIVVDKTTQLSVSDTPGAGVPMGLYTYKVTALNDDGTGLSSETERMMFGSAYTVPFTFDFDDETQKSSFTGYSRTGSLWTADEYNPRWSYDYGGGSVNDYLFTPQFVLQGGHKYRTTWNVSFYTQYTAHRFRFTVGKTKDAQTSYANEEYDETISGEVYQAHDFSNTFTADEDGEYYLGLNLVTQTGQWDYIYVNGMSIEEVFGNDLQAYSVYGFPKLNRGASQVYNVTVYNCGENTQSAYKVQTGYVTRKGEFIVLGETEDVPAVEGDSKVVVKVPTTADYDSGSTFDLCARVVLEGDENTGNDISGSMTITMEDVEGVSGFNAEFVGTTKYEKDLGDNTIPFATYFAYTSSVSIYPAEMLNYETDNNLVISRIGFVCDANLDIPSVNMKVYIGETTQSQFVGSPVGNPILPSSLSLVFDGTVETYIWSGQRCGLSVTLDQTYTYDPGKNLVVAVSVENLYGNGVIWGPHWVGWDRDLGFARSIRCYSLEWPSNLTNVYPLSDSPLPDLHLAVSELSGVDTVDLSDSALTVKVVGKTVYLSGDATSLRVVDLAGRVVDTRVLNGEHSVTLDVPAGVYVISAADSSGDRQVVKASIR